MTIMIEIRAEVVKVWAGAHGPEALA